MCSDKSNSDWVVIKNPNLFGGKKLVKRGNLFKAVDFDGIIAALEKNLKYMEDEIRIWRDLKVKNGSYLG